MTAHGKQAPLPKSFAARRRHRPGRRSRRGRRARHSTRPNVLMLTCKWLISFVSVAGALGNLTAERTNVDAARRPCAAGWDAQLGQDLDRRRYPERNRCTSTPRSTTRCCTRACSATSTAAIPATTARSTSPARGHPRVQRLLGLGHLPFRRYHCSPLLDPAQAGDMATRCWTRATRWAGCRSGRWPTANPA